MKITIDIDCTPQEARTFLGLPDFEPVQQAVLQAMQARMSEYIDNLDPESVLKSWMPTGAPGLEEIQKAFWSQFAGGKAKE